MSWFKRYLVYSVWVGLALVVASITLLTAGCTKVPETTTSTTEAVKEKVLAPGENWAITETEDLDTLIIGDGATITPPPGKSVTLTVDGTEQGQRLASTDGYDLVFVPGTYTGEVVVSVTEGNPVKFTTAGGPGSPAQTIVQPFRQALCIDSAGFSEFKSVLAAVSGTMPTPTEAEGLTINSTGECFNGVFAASSYALKNAEINLSGNGRSDLSGYGAGVVGVGQGTTLVLDGVNISTMGAVRSALVVDDGANVIVKNCELQSLDGELPADYVPTSDPALMRSAPWMLGLSGNVRATNLLGTATKVSYVNSTISSQGWGALAMDDCVSPTLTAINSHIAITGEDGYGAYATGSATEYFLGSDFAVPTYGVISRGASLVFGDSTQEKVAELNSSLRMGLTQAELAAIPEQGNMINSLRFGIMWHGGGTSGDAGTLEIGGATVLTTGETVFLDKGQAVKVNVDGAGGAKLTSGTGVIMQLMDDDDPGYDPITMQNTAVYNEPTAPPEADKGHDLTRAADGQDVLATFSNIALTGDFYNSTRGGLGLVAVETPEPTEGTSTTVAQATTTSKATTTTAKPAAGGTSTTSGDEVEESTTTTIPPGTELASVSKNLCLTFDKSSVTGLITASSAAHSKPSINAADYKLLGEVVDSPAAAVNNGVVVVLSNGSTWTVTGTCYLTSLAFDSGSHLVAPEGKTLTLMVNGKSKKIAAGTYTGKIELIVE